MMENYIACSLVSVVRFVVPRVRARNARESAAPYGVRAERWRVHSLGRRSTWRTS